MAEFIPIDLFTIRGDARKELSTVFGEAAKRRDPDVSDEYLKKTERQTFTFAPDRCGHRLFD